MTRIFRRLAVALSLAGAVVGLSACDPNATGTATVSTGVYYDSILWNDYYYGHPRPPSARPPRPNPPVARPPVARPPIHRPPVARPLPARPGRPR